MDLNSYTTLTSAFGGYREPVVFHSTHDTDQSATGHCAIQKLMNGRETFWKTGIVLGPPLTGIGWLISSHGGRRGEGPGKLAVGLIKEEIE